MDVIKVVGVVCSLLVVLLMLTVFIKNPEEALFEKTIDRLMKQEETSSFKDVLECFPELRVIQSQMEKLTELNNRIIQLTQGPAPNVSREESLLVQEYSFEAQQLRTSIKEELNLLSHRHFGKQP